LHQQQALSSQTLSKLNRQPTCHSPTSRLPSIQLPTSQPQAPTTMAKLAFFAALLLVLATALPTQAQYATDDLVPFCCLDMA
jgi:hypothetical protein